MLAEQEATLTLHTLLRIARHLGLPDDQRESQANELVRQTDITGMMRSLKEQLPEEWRL